MNAAEIERLNAALKQGMVYWRPYESAPAIRVNKIDEMQHQGLVAHLIGAAGYVALKTSELRDFIVAHPI